MKKLKEFFNGKTLRVSLLAAAMAAMLSIGVFAADETETTSATVISAFTTGFQGIVSNATSMIATMVPIALGLAGLIFLIRKAMSWFKGVAK